MDDCDELMPEYLRFVKGVVDASDLPLNVSREILQQNPQLEKIRKNLTGKTLDTIAEIKEKQYDDYVSFYGEFGPVIKEGIHTDFANKEKIAELLLFRSTKSGNDAFVTLKDYVAAMPSDQDEIYYLTGEKVEDIQHSPYLEVFKSRGQEVIFMTDPVDEWVVQGLSEYEGKSLKAVDKGDVSTDDAAKKAREENQETFKSLLESLNAKLDEVKDVRVSTRLTDSASCLVSDDGDMGAHMERLMRKMGRDGDMPESKRILELNASHPAVASLQALYGQSSDDPRIEVFGRLLYEQAVIAEGSRIQDPTAFAQRINDLMVKDLGDSAS
jgi:molecular chaperone HtpG